MSYRLNLVGKSEALAYVLPITILCQNFALFKFRLYVDPDLYSSHTEIEAWGAFLPWFSFATASSSASWVYVVPAVANLVCLFALIFAMYCLTKYLARVGSFRVERKIRTNLYIMVWTFAILVELVVILLHISDASFHLFYGDVGLKWP